MSTFPDISDKFNWRNLTPEHGHYTFGYYDRYALTSDNSLHLGLRIPQQERLPLAGEPAAIGFIDMAEGQFHQVGETHAWCHQQGAMTLWLKHRPRTFIYNDFVRDGMRWLPVARIYSLDEGGVGQYQVPIYAISKDGRWGVTLNFNRIPRRGYSYALAELPLNQPEPDLDGDGLSLVNMLTGKVVLIATYRQLIEQHPFAYDLENVYMWLNHAIFNCDASRVMVLFRTCQSIMQCHPWRTYMYTMRLDGSDLRCSLSDIYWRNGAISHQIWGRTPEEILVDADWGGHNFGHEYIVFDETQYPIQAHRISKGMGPAGHLNFSPDGKWLVADTYPDKQGIQRLALVRPATGDLVELGRFIHMTPGVAGDMRCDLHPRWSEDGTLLTVDTIHQGPRKIYCLDLGLYFQNQTPFYTPENGTISLPESPGLGFALDVSKI
jgi:hypothetical protein